MAVRRLQPARSATLVLTSPSLDPDAVTRTLGVEPDDSWSRGELMSKTRRAKVGGWCLESRRRAGASAEDHVEDLVKRVRHAKAEVRAVRASIRDIVVYLHLSEQIGVESCVLSPKLLGEIAEMKLALVFTAYRHGGEVA